MQDFAGIRIGLGHDTHRLEPGGPLILGGVRIEHDRHAVGHSDADVLLHAITDALLGAADLGDIGEMFPNTDEANRGRCSREMLDLAFAKVREGGYSILNMDCVVFAQRPRLLPYRNQIRQSIAGILRVEPHQIGLKGKTGEGVDAVGNQQAIAAQCVALLIAHT